MKIFVLTLFILSLTLTQSSPVSKKVEKRTPTENPKTESSPKSKTPENETAISEMLKSKLAKLGDANIEDDQDKSSDQPQDDKKKPKRDALSPENESENKEVDREKKECKTVRTAPSPATKVCLEISNSPSEVEICQDDPPPPPPPPPPPSPPEPQPALINYEVPQPICDVATPIYEITQPQVICETPQLIYQVPPPQPSSICFETTGQQNIPSIIHIPQQQFIQPQQQFIQPQQQTIQHQFIQPQHQTIQHQLIQPQQPLLPPHPLFSSHLSDLHLLHKQLQPNFNLQLPSLKHPLLSGNKHRGINILPSGQPSGISIFNPDHQFTKCTCTQNQGPLPGIFISSGNGHSLNVQTPQSSGGENVNNSGGSSPSESSTPNSGDSTFVPIANSRNSGRVMFRSPMMIQKPLMINSGPSRIDASWNSNVIPRFRYSRDPNSAGSQQENALKSEQHSQSSGQEKSSSIQISSRQSPSSSFVKRNSPQKSSQNVFPQSGMMNDNSKTNENSMDFDIQGSGIKSFMIGRNRQLLEDDNLATNGRFKDIEII